MENLRKHLDSIDEKGELIWIKERLSPVHEISFMLEKFDGKKVLFFEDIDGFDNKTVGGICGNRNWLMEALGVEPDNLYVHLLEAIKNPTPCKVVDGPVKEIISKPKLSDFPILTHFENDPGPYITSGVLYVRSSNGSIENVSFHRLLVLDDKRLAVRVVPRHLYRIKQMAKSEGRGDLDVSISIGLHPAILVAAALPAPFGISEFDVANTLLNGDLCLTECEHVNALAPAESEIVLEGKLKLDIEIDEGPFVDLTGTYDIKRQQPVIEVVGAMYREDYIYQALLPSGYEHRLLMGMPREARIWEYVRNVVPTVRGVNMTFGGMGWLHCVVSFEKFRDGDPKNVLMAIFAAHPSLKHAVVVDSDIDPHDIEQVEWAIATRFRGDEDLLVIPNVRVSSLDPTSDQKRELGCKVGIDATRPLMKPIEGFKKAKIPASDRVKGVFNRYKKDVF